MNIYEPYIEIEKQDALLRLKLSAKDRVPSVIASRVIPILVIISIFTSLVSETIPGSAIVIAGLLFLSVSTVIVINTKTGTEVYFKEDSIEIYSLRMIGKRKVIVPLQDASVINLEIFNDSRLSGAFYRIVMKNGKRILLLKIPTTEVGDKERIFLLNRKLEELTGLTIEQ